MTNGELLAKVFAIEQEIRKHLLDLPVDLRDKPAEMVFDLLMELHRKCQRNQSLILES